MLLAFLERGVILQRAGRYQESNEAFAAADEAGMAMVFTGKRHFLH